MRILILDDEVLLALDVSDALSTMGHDIVGPVHDKKAALSLLETEHVDFAILDYNLGDGNSNEVAELLLDRDIPIAFLTGYDASHLDKRFEHVPVIGKPFKMSDLQAAVRHGEANGGAHS